MSTTGRPADGAADAESAAAAIREAGFVRVVSYADGPGLAAAGVLARGIDVPFQVSVARTSTGAAERLADADEAAATVAFGFDADELSETPNSPTLAVGGAEAVRHAAGVVRELGGSPAEPVVLAGLRAAGAVPTEDDGAIERRPGVGIPTEDLADGLAHSTRLHGSWSGDESRAGATLAELELPADLDDRAHRRLASTLAVELSGGPCPGRATDALHGVLHPHVHPDCAYATIEGFGDVLDTLSRSAPGVAVAAAVGRIDRPTALDAWRDAAAAVHTAVTRARANVPTGDAQADGVHVATVSTEADAVSVARLIRDFVTDAPNVLVTDANGVALATTDADARDTFRGADAAAIGGTSDLAYATVETDDDVDALTARVRGVL